MAATDVKNDAMLSDTFYNHSVRADTKMKLVRVSSNTITASRDIINS